MTEPVLLIGNKNYSSWSLRPWLLLKHFNVAFREEKLRLDTPEFASKIGDWSGARRVPVLRDGTLSVWDSLAICEFINERWLQGRGWPADLAARSFGRAIASEMHSGFAAMRTEMPMNVRRPPRVVALSANAQIDVQRVQQIWMSSLQRFGGPWLLGEFSIADAFYAPVAWRFHGYASAVAAPALEYLEALIAHSSMQQWASAAHAEIERLPQDDL